MEWTRSETLALAAEKCTTCHGSGLRELKAGDTEPCNCVFRAIFRACYNRFVHCATKEKYMSRVVLEHRPGRDSRAMWGRKDEEYIADFLLVTRRSLSEFEHKIFRYHYLLGADWKLCCRKLNIDKGMFFHTVYRIQQKLGRIYRELQPYSLYPLDEYFNGATVRTPAKVIPIRSSANRLSTVVPLKRNAA
jgi:hypothetical protein